MSISEGFFKLTPAKESPKLSISMTTTPVLFCFVFFVFYFSAWHVFPSLQKLRCDIGYCNLVKVSKLKNLFVCILIPDFIVKKVSIRERLTIDSVKFIVCIRANLREATNSISYLYLN